MAYDHFQMERTVAAAATIASSGSVGNFNPGYQPVVVRAIAVVLTTATTADATVLTVRKRPAGQGQTSGQETVATVTVPVGAIGTVVFKDDLEVRLEPGENLNFDSDGGSTAGAGDIVIFYQPAWDSPDNNDSMVRSAT